MIAQDLISHITNMHNKKLMLEHMLETKGHAAEGLTIAFCIGPDTGYTELVTIEACTNTEAILREILKAVNDSLEANTLRAKSEHKKLQDFLKLISNERQPE